MTLDELITNASPEQLREALRKVVDTCDWARRRSDGIESVNIPAEVIEMLITNALEGKE